MRKVAEGNRTKFGGEGEEGGSKKKKLYVESIAYKIGNKRQSKR